MAGDTARVTGVSLGVMTVPENPKIYHILHVDRLPSIIKDGYLWCDREALSRNVAGTTIGMGNIKQRRLNELTLTSHPDLYVGDCVPFYFCPRSVMLYLIYMMNHPNLSYRGGQGPIVHLESDLHRVVEWADTANRRWAFTTSNAGSNYFDNYSDLTNLDRVDWSAVEAIDWRDCRGRKQAEFLVEHSFPWELVQRIGTYSPAIGDRVANLLKPSAHRPPVKVIRKWYY